MNAIEHIFDGYISQKEDSNYSEAVCEASAVIEQQLVKLVPLDKVELIYRDIMTLSLESQKQGFVEGFQLAVSMMRECEA